MMYSRGKNSVLLEKWSDFDNETCFQFVYVLYKQSLSDEGKEPSMLLWDLAKKLQLSRAQAKELADSLQKQSLLTFVSLSGVVELSSLGRFEVMLALSQPSQATRFFPAIESFTQSDFSFDLLKQRDWLRFVDQLHDFSYTLNAQDESENDLLQDLAQLELLMFDSKKTLDKPLINELQALYGLLQEPDSLKSAK